MKVLLTTERFLPDFGGGGEYIVFQTAKHLQELGLDVRVLTRGDPGRTEYEGISTQRLNISRYRMNLAVRAIAAAADGVDLIQTFNYHACLPSLVAGRWIGKPVVCIVLGLFQEAWTDLQGRIFGQLYAGWEKMLLRARFARTIFLSDYSRKLAIQLGTKPELALVNNPGVDPALFQTSGEKDGSVLFVGKLEERKGISDVLAVAEKLPAVRFRIAGWGPEEGALRSAAPSNVEFLGFLKGPMLYQAFAQATVFLFPSRAETFGLVIAEAMAARCVVVSTVPLEYEGVRVKAGDVATMACAIDQTLANSSRSQIQGERNRESARRYTWEHYSEFLVKTYHNVLKEAHS